MASELELVQRHVENILTELGMTSDTVKVAATPRLDPGAGRTCYKGRLHQWGNGCWRNQERSRCWAEAAVHRLCSRLRAVCAPQRGILCSGARPLGVSEGTFVTTFVARAVRSIKSTLHSSSWKACPGFSSTKPILEERASTFAVIWAFVVLVMNAEFYA